MNDTTDRADLRVHPVGSARFDAWPADLQAWFDGTSIEDKIGFTASLVTRGADGRLGTSLLGIGELHAPDPHTLRLALWAQARAARALAEGGRAALTFVFDATFYQVQLDVVPIPSAQAEAAGLVCFSGTLAAGEAQRVPYASLETGITFALEASERDAVLRRWRAQIEWLGQLGRAGA